MKHFVEGWLLARIAIRLMVRARPRADCRMGGRQLEEKRNKKLSPRGSERYWHAWKVPLVTSAKPRAPPTISEVRLSVGGDFCRGGASERRTLRASGRYASDVVSREYTRTPLTCAHDTHASYFRTRFAASMADRFSISTYSDWDTGT